MHVLAARLIQAGKYAFPLLLCLAAWYLVSVAGWVRPLFLPSPMDVLRQFVDLWQSGDLLAPFAVSLYRALAGLLLSILAGIALGLFIQRSERARVFLEPLVALGFPTPKIAFMPIFILWFGIDDLSKILLVMFTCVFPMIVATYHGAATVPKNFIWSAESLGTSESLLLRSVIFPAALPHIFSGIRVAVPVALITAYTAEMVGGGGGLGAALMYSQRMMQTAGVFAYIVVMLLSGIVLDQLLLALRGRILPWLEENAG